MFWTLLLTVVYMLVQAGGGLLSGSLALLADSGHMLADAGALGLAWVAARLAHKPSDALRSYGYHRFQILAAYTNGIALFVVAALIVIEAAKRLHDPQPVLGTPMLAVAVVGLAVNVIALLVLRRGSSNDLNVRAAILHVAGDMLGSVAAIVAAIVILLTGWTPIDPLLSILITLLILRVALDLVKRSGHILMEGIPEGFAEEELKADLAEIPGVAGVHHVHAWVLSSERTIATLHLQVRPDADAAATVDAVKRRLHERHGIWHSTVQVESGDCPDHLPKGSR